MKQCPDPPYIIFSVLVPTTYLSTLFHALNLSRLYDIYTRTLNGPDKLTLYYVLEAKIPTWKDPCSKTHIIQAYLLTSCSPTCLKIMETLLVLKILDEISQFKLLKVSRF